MKLVYTLAATAVVAMSAVAVVGMKTSTPKLTLEKAGKVQVLTKGADIQKLIVSEETLKDANKRPMNAAPAKVTEQDGNLVITKVNGVITGVSGVESKMYERAATGTTYFVEEGKLYYAYQSGNVEVKEDGNSVYIKDPLTRFTQGSWVKGTKEGNTISIPTWQPLLYVSDYNASICLAWGDANNGYEVSEHSDVITFTVDGNTLTLEGTTSLLTGKGYLIGAYWNDDLTYQGYWDAETVLNYDPEYVAPTVLELPEGLEAEEWYLNGFDKLASRIKDAVVPVAFDGNDVYIAPFTEDFPGAYIKGTLSDGVIEFENIQYIGNYGSYEMYCFGATFIDDETATIENPTAIYDAEAKSITFTNVLVENAAKDRLYYLDYIENAVITAEMPPFVEPIITEATSTLPYFNGFDSAKEQAEAVIYDANEDGKTFLFSTDATTRSTTVKYSYSVTNAADDYVVFPGLPLEAGKEYTIQMDVRNNGYEEKFEVVAGTVAKISEMTLTVIPETVVTQKTYSTFENKKFTVEEDGIYYIAIHCTSDADKFYMFIDNFSVEEYAVKSIAELNACELGETVKAKLTNALVTYSNNGIAFVEDETGANQFSGLAVEAGDIINGTLVCTVNAGIIATDADLNSIEKVGTKDVTKGANIAISDLAKPENLNRLVTVIVDEENPYMALNDEGMAMIGNNVYVMDVFKAFDYVYPAKVASATGIIVDPSMYLGYAEEDGDPNMGLDSNPILLAPRSVADFELIPYTVAEIKELEASEYAYTPVYVKDLTVTMATEDNDEMSALYFLEDETGALIVQDESYATEGFFNNSTKVTGTLHLNHYGQGQVGIDLASSEFTEEQIELPMGTELDDYALFDPANLWRLAKVTHTEETPIENDGETIVYNDIVMVMDMFGVIEDIEALDKISEVHGIIFPLEMALGDLDDEFGQGDVQMVVLVPRSANDIKNDRPSGVGSLLNGNAIDGPVYDLNGVKVGNSLKDLKKAGKGVYIVNGKKVFVL